MSNRIINIGVIGTGGMGGRHVRNLTNEVASAHLMALMDVDRARMQELAPNVVQRTPLRMATS